MVLQRTSSLLAGATINRQLQVFGLGMIGFTPSLMRRSEQSDHGHLEWLCEMPWSRVCRDQQVCSTHGRLGQAQAEIFFRQADHCGMVSNFSDFSSDLAFSGATENKDSSFQSLGDLLGQQSERFRRPVLGRPKGTA